MKILFYCGIHNLVNFDRIRSYYDLCYGFDANPDKVENARKVFQNDPEVKIIFGALTEKSGESVEFTITTNWDPSSSLGDPNPEYIHMKSGRLVPQKKILVPTINLLEFCQSENIGSIDTLITDLQGMDYTVLKTLEPMIKKGMIREIQSEVEPDSKPPIYLGIPSNKLSAHKALLTDNYDLLWTAPQVITEEEWEMDVRWRVKNSDVTKQVEFIMDNELLIPKVNDFIINFVYGHRAEKDLQVYHKGNVSILSSSNPVEGCNAYVYTNAFSYKGKQQGLDCLLMLEPFVVLPGEYDHQVWKHFDHIFGVFEDLSRENYKYHKILFPRADLAGQNPITEVQSQRESLYPLLGRKNAICMISSNKSSHVPSELYSKRIEAAQWFADYSKIPFDVYGTPPFVLPNYRGPCPVPQKLSVMKQYRYNLCFENTDHMVLSAGYVTEKILDCLETRTIPIYMGASNIEQYIPAECFIDFRKLSDFKELDLYLHSISESKYINFIDSIDAFVCGGGLKKYSESALYDDVVKILIDNQSPDFKYFNNDTIWRPGFSSSTRKREWKTSNRPIMWTWKHLSKAEPPPIENGKILERNQSKYIDQTRSTSKKYHKSLSIRLKPTIKILAAGRKFAFGNARLGFDYSWWNLFDALIHFKNIKVEFFDYATEIQQRGLAGMSDHLEEIVRKGNYDFLFYVPYDLQAGILLETLKSITGSSDIQSILWMDNILEPIDQEIKLWAPCANHIITTSPRIATHCIKEGFGAKLIKSQWGFNPFTYSFKPSSRAWGITFCGSSNGHRTEILHKFNQRGLSVEVFGSGWPEDPIVSFHELVKIFRQSKINLNLGDSPVLTTQPIKRRTFEVPGCQGFLLTTPAVGLEEYYEPGKELVIASSPEEIIEKSKYYFTHECERKKIAKRGHLRTLADHTWSRRLVDIFMHIGFKAIPLAMPHITPRPYRPSGVAFQEGKFPPADTNPLSINRETNDNDLASVCILAFNQLEYTKICIESILHYTTVPYELLLVDNGSTDGTFEYFESIKKYHPQTKIIKNFKNRIAESIINYATSLASGKYFVFVSNDTVVHEGWLEHLIQHIESAPDVGWVGPRSNSISGPQVAPADYDTIETFQSFAVEWSKQHRGENFPVCRLAGMLVITKKEILKRIGGADPDLAANARDGGYGFSDDDLSIRYTLAGYRLLVANDVFIHHFGSITARQYRADLFGDPQNINKEKYLKKLKKHKQISINEDGKMTLTPYTLEDPIPVAENTIIRSPRIGIFEKVFDDAEDTDCSIGYTEVIDEYQGQNVFRSTDSLQKLLTHNAITGEYDFIVFVIKQHAPEPEKVLALLKTALDYPDIAILCPQDNFVPSTFTTGNGKSVEIAQYVELSFCVINIKLIQPFINRIALMKSDEDFFWFLQRRVRGEGYFIAKANKIIAVSSYPYDDRFLPEQMIKEKRYAEAIAIYKEDLSKDPTFVESIYQLATIAKDQLQFSAAIQYAEDALKIDPHHIQSLIMLSRIFLKKGNLNRAESFVRQANFKQPGNPEVQEIVNLYEAQLNGQPGLFQGESIKIIPSPPKKPGLISIVLRLTMDLEAGKKRLQDIQKLTPELHEVIFLVPRSFPSAIKWVKKCSREHHNYILVEYDEAPGFSQEVNRGIQASSGEIVLLLDEYVRVTENWLKGLLECLHSRANAGVIGPVTDLLINRQRIGGSGESNKREDLAEYAKSFRIRNRYRRLSRRKIPGLCMLFRYELLEKIGYFDEELRSGMFADEDFCLRAALGGFQNLIAGDVFVHYPACGDYNRDLYNSRKVFDMKWRGINTSSDLGKKVVTLKTIDAASNWYYQKQQIDKAIESLAEGVKYTSEDPTLYRFLALLLIDAGLYQDALEALQAMPEQAQQEVESLELFGSCYERINRFEEANACADRLLLNDQLSAPALNLKGMLSYKQGDRTAAEKFFRLASETDPGYGDPLTNLGVTEWGDHKQEEALNHLERGFLLTPTTTDNITLYFNAVASLSEFARAESIFREAKTLYPRNKRIFFLYIDLLLRQEKYPEAMQEVEEALVTFDLDDGIIPAALQIREKIGTKHLSTQPIKRGTLSLCMIVKNEEEHLAKCLMSVREIADEMIVVDTGSIDKTKEIATAFGAQVFDFIWINDFSEARNYSLAQAKGDWILVLDGDEVLAPADHAALAKIVHRKSGKPVSYSIVTRNYTNIVTVQGWTPNDGSYTGEEAGTGWNPSTKVRLFPNDKRIKFRNPVHEVVEPSIMEAGIDIKPGGFPVHHYGKMNAEKTVAKGEDYYLLGRKKLKETGGDAMAIQELAIQAGELGRHGEAVELWQKLIEIQPGNAFAYFNKGYSHLKLKQYAETIRTSKKALELNPDLKEAVLNYANGELVTGDIDKAVALLNNVIKRIPEYPPALGLLAATLAAKGERAKALSHFSRLSQMGFDCIDYLYDLADMLALEGRYKAAVLLLEAAIESNNTHQDTQSLLACCQARLQDHDYPQLAAY